MRWAGGARSRRTSNESVRDVQERYSRGSTPDLLPPSGTTDGSSIATGRKKKAAKEIKEWQAIMDYLSALPVKNKGELPVIPVDERAAEVRAIKEG